MTGCPSPSEILLVMLQFTLSLFLAVLFEEAVILGAASDALAYKYSSPSCYQSTTNLHDLPYCILERTVSKGHI